MSHGGHAIEHSLKEINDHGLIPVVTFYNLINLCKKKSFNHVCLFYLNLNSINECKKTLTA